MSLTKDGFYKSFSGAIGNNNYLLEAGGGHIGWGNAANQIPYSNGTVNTSLNADMTDGLHVHSGRNNEANKIVRTDGSGYIQAGWINTTSGDMGTTDIDRVYCSNDSYIRYKTVANFKTALFGGQVGSPSVPIYWTGSAFATCIVSFGNQSYGEHNANNINDNGIKYYNANGPSTSLGATTGDGALYSQAYSTSWVAQIAQDYRNGGLYVRGKNNGTWQSWYRVWDNRTTYVSGGKGYIGGTEITQVNNSDMVDGLHASGLFTQFVNNGSQTTRITIGGTTKDLKIDADLLDGRHAGVQNGQVSIFVPWPSIATMQSEGLLTTNYGTSGYGHPDEVYLQAICKWAIAHYTNLGDITLIGSIAPNSSGTCIMHLYSSSGKDSTTLLPRYCASTYQTLSGPIYEFGCSNYTWYYRKLSAGNADSLTNPGKYYWANLSVQTASSNTTVPSFGAIRMNGASSAGTNYITGSAGRIYFGGNFHIDSLGSNATYINYYTANNVYMVSGSSQGKVGIGTTSVSYKLTVTEASTANHYTVARFNNSQHSGIEINSGASYNPFICLVVNNTQKAEIGYSAASGRIYLGNYNTDLGWLNIYSDRGNVTIGDSEVLSVAWGNSNLIVGKDTEKAVIGQLASSTNGVVFGAHNQALSAWAPVNLAGTIIYFRNNESIRAKILDGCLSLFPAAGSYREGIRIHSYGSWSDILLCGNDATGDSGTSANSWFIGNNNGNFYINRNGSSDAKATRLYGHANGYTFGSTSRSSANVTVTSWLEVTGSASATMSYNTTNPRITFSESGSQAVGIVYTDYDSYRTSKGLKVMDVDNSDTGNVWLEVQGSIYGNTVYSNLAGSSTAGGVSLYSTSDPITEYGITFRGTGSYGKFGRVQGDWATYLTMDSSSNRGWIFRSGGTNYASISARGEAYYSSTGRDYYIAYPNGGQSVGNGSSVTGAIAIYLPTTTFKCCTMLKFTIEIYEYSGSCSTTYTVAGYNYSDSQWYNTTAYSLRQGTNGKGNLRVRFGDDGSTRNIIWIGETNTTWSYPQVYIKDITLGHSGYDYNRWAAGWSIGFVTSFGNVRTYIDNPAVNYYANNANSAGNADTVDTYHANRFAFTYNSANYTNSSSVSVNDLITNGVSNASHGMIYAATDNPVGSANWVHVWSQQWTIGTTSSWVSQIALGVQQGTGMWYRTTSGNVVGRGWTRVLDSSNYTSYVNNYYWANIKISTSSSTDTSPTFYHTYLKYYLYMQDSGGNYRAAIDRSGNSPIFGYGFGQAGYHVYYTGYSVSLNGGTSWSSTGNGIYINSSNNIGIGCNDPSYKLDISGNIRVRSGNQILIGTISKGSSDIYNGGIQLREATYSTTSCTDNMYDGPGITFHWGGWWVHKLNMHSNDIFWDNNKIWHSGNDGSGSGLDADLLDGYHAGNSSGQIPISNGTVCSNLNADMVDSQHFTYSNSSNSPTYLWGTNSSGSNFLAARGSITVGYATYANNVYVTQNISSNADYPLIWTNQNNTSSAWGQQLYKSYDYLLYNPSTKVLRNDGPLWLRPDRDATLKIYSGKVTDGYSDGFIKLQTSIDGTDGETHSYPGSYQGRCVLFLQPRGGEVYIGKDITAASTSGDTTYKLNVGGHGNFDGNIWSRGSGVYLRLGPQNSSYAHYETNAGTSHWFNKRIDVDGDIYLYGTSVRMQKSNGYVYSSGFYHNSYGSATYLLRSDGGAAAFNWSGQSGQPTWIWGGNSQHNYYVYNPSNFSVNYANSAGSATNASWLTPQSHFHTGRALGYAQTNNGPLDGSNSTGTPTSWAHYILMSHDNGQTYFHYQLAFPFWDAPMYQRKEGGSSTSENQKPWYKFITTENYESILNMKWTNKWGPSDSYTFSNNGLRIQQTSDESSGIHFNGDYINLWSPCDSNYSLRYFDEDNGNEVWNISSSGHFSGSAASANYATSAGNADTVDGYHASSFMTIWGGGAWNFNIADNTKTSGVYYVHNAWTQSNVPFTYGVLADFNTDAGHLQIAGGQNNDIKARSYWWTYNNGNPSSFTYTSWVTLLTSANWSSYISAGSNLYQSHNGTTSNLYPMGSSTAGSGNRSTLYTRGEFYFNNTGAYHTSDIRKKYDIRDIYNKDVIDLFNTENAFIRFFRWKEDNQAAYGFIAQELQEYCPEAVDFNNDTGFYSVNYNVAFSKIVGAMFKKIKELEKRLKEKENS